MATAHRLAQPPPDWTQQVQFLQAQNQVPWQLSGGVPLFPLNSQQQLDPAQFHNLQQDWVSSIQSAECKRFSIDDSGSDPSTHKTGESLKEKNRKAQAKHRAKQKVSSWIT